MPSGPNRGPWFAIQHKSTKRFLPAPPLNQKGGQTHISFEDFGPPRLFPSSQGANVAMKLWLRGDWMGGRSYHGGKKVQFANSRMHLAHDVHVVKLFLEYYPEETSKPIVDIDNL